METYQISGELACQQSANLFWPFVVSGRSVPSLVIILEFYSDARRTDFEFEPIFVLSGKKFLPAGKKFLPDTLVLSKSLLKRI